MSELKAVHAYQLTTNTEDSDVYIHNDEFGCGGDLADFYLKSEADKVIARHKHKRCLAMAQEWRSYATFCGMQSSCHNHRGFGKTAEKWTWKEIHAWKCKKRWLELAEKFKEAK